MASRYGEPAVSPPSPRLLWVTAEAPHHRRGGGAIRQAYLIDGLARMAEVELLVVGRLDDPDTEAVTGGVVELDDAPPPRRGPWRRRWWDLRRLAAGRPAELADRAHQRSALAIELGRRLAAGLRYDLVHVEHLGLAGVSPPGLGRRLSLGVQNVPSVMARHAAALATGTRRRALWRGEEMAALRWERRAAASTDVVVVVSDQDGHDLTPGPEVVVAPNGVDTSRWTPTPVPSAPRVVFTGTLDYLPNVDAVLWLVSEVMPLVRRAVPAAELEVVGRSPTASVRAAATGAGVALAADVADTAGHLAAARVAVVPVRIGSGTRLKALEAMAAARPVVGTSIGLGGLAVREGEQALIADRAPDLAQALVRVLGDDALAAGLAAAGRRLVEDRYDWIRIGDEFASAITSSLP